MKARIRILPQTFVVAALLAGAACDKNPEPATVSPEPPPPTDAPPAAEPPPPAEPAEDPAVAEAKRKEAENKQAADAQIAQGKDLFAQHCASCHGENGEGKGKHPPVVGEKALLLDAPKGAKKRKGQQFQTAADVLTFVQKHMPLKKPGSLKPEEYVAILAFDLTANGVSLVEPLSAPGAANIQLGRQPPPSTEPAADASKGDKAEGKGKKKKEDKAEGADKPAEDKK